MAQNPNQFNQSPELGGIDQSVPGVVLNGQISPNESATLIAGDKVKIEDLGGGVPKVLKVVSDADTTFGILPLNRKDVNYIAEEPVEIAVDNSIIWQEAGAAIARGARLEVVASTQKVITNAGVNKDIGFAFDKAAADGDLIRVYVQSLAQDTSEANALVQTITVLVSLAELNAGKTIIAAVTGKQIRVVDYTATAVGTFASHTSADLEDETGQKVTVLAVADLDDAILLPSDGALGALYAKPLTISEALVVANVGSAATAGTSIEFTVQFELV